MSGVWDPTRPELDRDPPLSPPVPTVSYVICSTHRSGSGLLCRGLASTGMGGVPAEYFNPNQRVPLTRRWRCDGSVEGYAAALRGRRTDAAGTFGIKLHWDQLEQLCAERARRGTTTSPVEALRELFPGCVFIHIVRLDLAMQSVSYWRAIRSDVWAERLGATTRPAHRLRYSYRGILHCWQRIADQELAWQRAFMRAGISPVDVVYEDLVGDFRGEVLRVLGVLTGVSGDADVDEPDSRRQADSRSPALAQRFEADRRRHLSRSFAARVQRTVRRFR
jgi:LPS sulfotransferase NodH